MMHSPGVCERLYDMDELFCTDEEPTIDGDIEVEAKITPQDFEAILQEAAARPQVPASQQSQLVQQAADSILRDMQLVEDHSQAGLCPWEELHRMDTLLAQEEERRTEAESALQCANVEFESLQAELEAAARAQSEQQSKLSLHLEYAQRDLETERNMADAAQRQLRDLDRNSTIQVRELEGQVRARQTEAAAAQQALQLVKAEHSQAYLIPLEELKRVQKGLAQEEERRAEAESSLQCATLDMESLQAELEAVARAEAEQQSKLSLQLEYAKQELVAEQKVASDALSRLRNRDRETTVQVRELEGQVRARQAEATAAQRALQLAEAENSQEMLALQEELHQERRRVKEAESGLEDGFVQVDNLERQLNRAVKKMQRAATGLHHAIHPFYKGKIRWGRTLRTAKYKVEQMRLCLEAAQEERDEECEVTIQQSHDIADLTQHLSHLQAELAQLKVVHAQLQHEVLTSGQLEEELQCNSQAAPVTQSSMTGSAERLQRENGQQAAAMMKLQAEVYRLRRLLTAHGIQPDTAIESSPVSVSSPGSTPMALRDTSTPSSGYPAMAASSPLAPASSFDHSPEYRSKLVSTGLSGRSRRSSLLQSPSLTRLPVATPPPVALTPAGAVQTPTDRMLSDVEKDVAQLLQRLANRAVIDERSQSAASALRAAAILVGMSSSSGLATSPAGPALPLSPAASAGTPVGSSSSSVGQSKGASPTFSGSPVAGLRRTVPNIAVRLTKKEKARQEHLAQRFAKSTTPASAGSSAASHKSAPSKRSLTTPDQASFTTSVTAGRTPLSHGRTAVDGRTALVPGSTANKAAAVTGRAAATSTIDFCGSGDKENTPKSGKLCNTSITGSGKGRAVLSLLTKMAHTKPFGGLSDGVGAAPGMTPHALQFRPGVVPFWGCGSVLNGPTEATAIPTAESAREKDVNTGVILLVAAEESKATAEVQFELAAKGTGAEVSANEQGSSDFEVPMSEVIEASPLATAAQQAATAETSVPSTGTSGSPVTPCDVRSGNIAISRRAASSIPANASGALSSGAPERAAVKTGRRAAPASAVITVASRMVTRSQLAAQKSAECRQTRSQLAAQQHITRMQTRRRTSARC